MKTLTRIARGMRGRLRAEPARGDAAPLDPVHGAAPATPIRPGIDRVTPADAAALYHGWRLSLAQTVAHPAQAGN
jgi:hypothetical protein